MTSFESFVILVASNCIKLIDSALRFATIGAVSPCLNCHNYHSCTGSSKASKVLLYTPHYSAKLRIIRRKEMFRTSAASVPAAIMMMGTNHVSTTIFITRAASNKNQGSMSALRFEANAPNLIMISRKK